MLSNPKFKKDFMTRLRMYCEKNNLTREESERDAAHNGGEEDGEEDGEESEVEDEEDESTGPYEYAGESDGEWEGDAYTLKK